MASFLVNPRWIDIPEDDIVRLLNQAGDEVWQDKIIGGQHYLFGGNHAYPYSLPPEVVGRLSSRLNEARDMTWYQDYNDQAIAHFNDKGDALNQAFEYWLDVGDTSLPKPEILPTDGIQDGVEYIAVVGLFHLTGVENSGNHHLYIDLVDAAGNRIYNHNPPLELYWGWDGMSQDEARNVAPIRIDKPPNEPGANMGITWSQVIYGFHINNIACDRFRGVHTRYGNDGPGNNQGHHSHYIVLQKRVFHDVGTPPDPEPPDPPPPDTKAVMLIDKAWLDQKPVVDGFIVIESDK